MYTRDDMLSIPTHTLSLDAVLAVTVMISPTIHNAKTCLLYFDFESCYHALLLSVKD